MLLVSVIVTSHVYIKRNRCSRHRTSPLVPASEYLKKGFSAKYILVCTCPNGQVDFLGSLNIFVWKMAQIT